mgnify:CR=1 FL=1
MKKSKVIEGYDLSGVSNLHGLSLQQYYDLLKYQEFKCPVSGFEFSYDSEKKKFIDTKGGWKFSKKRIAPPIDHSHETGYIRGILSENINLLENQWGHGTYGPITKPPELTEYQKNPPAEKCIGFIKYK